MMRHRSLFLAGGALLALAASYFSDPDGGWSTVLGGLSLIQGVWAIAAAHWARKALFDYDSADSESLFKKAAETPTGAGMGLIALAIVFVGLLLVFAPRAHAADQLPPGYAKYGAMLYAEQKKFWPEHPDPALLAALVEQESCASKKMCWNPEAKLSSKREEGAGLGQITRAYKDDGSTRFDALAGLSKQYSALKEMNWATIYQRPDLQLRAIVLMSRDAAAPFKKTSGMLAFGDAGYNGGPGGVMKERRACQMAPGCDPDKWFGHVEHHCLKSKQPLYGNKSACDINREHVRNVLIVRAPKYRAALNT